VLTSVHLSSRAGKFSSNFFENNFAPVVDKSKCPHLDFSGFNLG
jgi:hypothetical protein